MTLFGRLQPVRALVGALFSIATAAALYAGLRAAPELNPLRLETLEIRGAAHTSAEDLAAAADLYAGRSMLGIDVTTVRDAVKALPWVAEARVVRQLPATLRVHVQEHQAAYLVKLDRLYYLTRDAQVIRAPLEQGLDLPVVTGASWATLEGGGPLQTALVELGEQLAGSGLAEVLSELHLDPERGLTVYTTAERNRAIHLGFAGFGVKLARLERLDRHLRPRQQRAVSVDLSYADKIIATLAPARGTGARP